MQEDDRSSNLIFAVVFGAFALAVIFAYQLFV